MTLDHLDKWATWSEIAAQPAIWRNWGRSFDLLNIADWIAARGVDEIWLSGAGTSAYIGDIIASALEGVPAPASARCPAPTSSAAPGIISSGAHP